MKYKIGDKVRIISMSGGHKIPMNTIITLNRIDALYYIVRGKFECKQVWNRYINDSHIELVNLKEEIINNYILY